tara:strand:+ start:30569 stop:30781 length:213 start_codon:yes stop_codon:yes gene_type:complete
MKSTYTNTIERGILTSAYKKEIRANISESKRSTVSKMKFVVENHQANGQSEIGTILRVALFFVAIVLITF